MRTADLGSVGEWQKGSKELDNRGNQVSFPSSPYPLSFIS
jgi:hypothetical protein